MTTRVFSGTVGSLNTDDIYALTLSAAAIETFTLTGLSGSARLNIEDARGNIIYSSSGSQVTDPAIIEALAPGTYYVDVNSSNSNQTNYTLTATSNVPSVGNSSVDSAGSTTATARSLGALSSIQIADWVGNADRDDVYGFTLSVSSTVHLVLSGVQAGTTLYLLDAAGKTITSNGAAATTTGSIIDNLASGTYYIDVRYSNGDTGYNLAASATAIPNGAGISIASAPSLGALTAAPVTRSDFVGSVDTDDYYAFTVTSPSEVLVRLTSTSDFTRLYILNVAGTQILSNSGYSDTNLKVLLAAGTYFVQVDNTNNPGAVYSLTASAIASTNPAGTSTATAFVIPSNFISTPYVDSVSINPSYGGDYYQFTVGAVTPVNLRVSTSFYSSTLTLYDSTGTRILSGGGSPSADAIITDTLAPGSYYVGVASGSAGDIGSYTFTASAGTPPFGSGATDTAGSTLGTARDLGALGVTQSIAEYVGTNDTIDYYKFALASASTLNVTLLDATSASSLTLQDAAGNTLIPPNASTVTSIVDPLAAGTYYLKVAQNAASTGYNLTVSAPPVTIVTGGTIATAISFGTLSPGGGIVSGYVGAVEPVNDFAFTIAAPSLVRLDVSSEDPNVGLALLDAAGSNLASSGNGYNSDASYDVYLAAGSYYASVTSSRAAGATYTLTAKASPVQDVAGNTIATARPVATIAPADYNADAQSDLVLDNDNGQIVIETQAGLGITGGTSVSNPGPSWHVVSSADLDGNGSPDLLLQNDNGSITDFIMSGTTAIGGFNLANPGPTWHVRGVGDFNLDGKGDMVLQNDNGLIIIEYTNGGAVIAGATVGNPGSSWTVEGVADFNGDGQSDLLLENTNGQIVDYLMNGATPVVGELLATLPTTWSVAGTGNFKGDNRADIVVHNDDGTNVVLYTNGVTVVGSGAPIGNPGANWTGVVAGMDYNGDGASDLLLENTAGSLVGFTVNTTNLLTGSASLGTPGAGWRAIGNTPMQFINGGGSTLAPLVGTIGVDEFNLTTLGVAGLHSISGFDPAKDLIALSAANFASYAQVQAAVLPYQGGTFIGLPGGSGVLIQGVAPTQLSSSDFVLR